MRIAIYMPRLRPGSMSWTIYNGLADALRELGPEVEIWSDPEGGEPTPTDNFEYLPHLPAHLRDRLARPFTRTARLGPTTRTLAAQLRRRPDVDVLYAEIAYPYGAAAALARRRAGWGGKLVIKPTGEDVMTIPEASYGYGRHWVPRVLTRWTLRQADAIRCISPLVVDAIAPFTHAPQRLIPSAVAPATMELAAQDAGTHATWRAECRDLLASHLDLGDAPIVLALGRLHPFKGLDTAIRAMRDIPNAVLVIAGPSRSVRPHGDHGAWLKGQAAANGVTDRVRFTGAISHEDVHRWLGGADLVVVPSIAESMNKVSVEAVAAGTPFIATSTTGVTHYLDGPGVGQTVPPRDHRALGDAIEAVLSGRWQFDRAEAGKFVAKFSPQNAAAQLLELIEAS